MENRNYKSRKKGTILLLIASLGFLLASLWFMQVQIKPRNTGNIETSILAAGNKGEAYMFYIDQSAEYSLQKSLEIKSRYYMEEGKTKTNRDVCNLQLDTCEQGKQDCETNIKQFCKDEILKGFKEMFGKYIKTLNEQTGNKLDINEYEFDIKINDGAIEVIGKTTKTLQAKEKNVEYSIKPNFKIKSDLRHGNV